jgi:hypothetical protein
MSNGSQPVMQNAVIDITVPKLEIYRSTNKYQRQKFPMIYSGFFSTGDHTINFTEKNCGGMYMLKCEFKNIVRRHKICLK